MGHDEETAAIRAVRDDAAEETEREPGDRAREPDQTEVERRELRGGVPDRQLHDEPPEAELLHPRADVRHEQADPEEAEVTVEERRQRRRPTGVGRGRFIEGLGLGGDRVLHSVLRECMGVEPTTERATPRQRF